jgi:hypothetical protein
VKTAAILIARLIFAFVFAMGAAFKLALVGIDATAAEIAGAGFPFPVLLAWVAAFFELGLAFTFLTGVYFSEAAVVTIAYVLSWPFRSTVPTISPRTRWSSASSSTISSSSPDCCLRPFTAPAGPLFCGRAQSDQ